jgi:cold shock CspA family protein/ribosome-associated translation inhibitor RaiA
MQTEPEIAFHGVEPSDALRAQIEHRIAQLERFHAHITRCRVTIELPHRRHQQGNRWQIKLVVAVPGDEIVVNREGDAARDGEPAAAVRDAFDAARRQLQDHARRHGGEVKHHEGTPSAAVIAVGADHGFLATDDGRQVYFHAHAVLDDAFDRLSPGARVTFVEEDGVEGPQASTVRLLR